jgi:hypothetical protein
VAREREEEEKRGIGKFHASLSLSLFLFLLDSSRGSLIHPPRRLLFALYEPLYIYREPQTLYINLVTLVTLV